MNQSDERSGKIYHGEGAEAIANAVVLLAVDDYRKALQDYKTGNAWTKSNARREMFKIEAFFKSENGEIMARGHNHRILRMLKKEYEKEIG